MMVNKLGRGLIAFSVALLVLVPATAPAANAYPCTNKFWRAGNIATNVSVADGVLGVLRTPAQGEITGLTSNRGPSAADILLENSIGFVQAGWRLGTSTGLPYTTTPRMFWGDGTFGGSEVLHDGPTLSWGTYYEFRIYESPAGSGHYRVLLQGSAQGTTTSTRTGLGRPGFNGEVNTLCVRMEARAYHANAPQRTLQYYYGGSWNYWDSGRFDDQPYFFSVNAGDIATNYSYGGGS